MMRLTTFLLCIILAAAAAGRYKAEVAVRDTKNEIRALDRQKTEELSSIQVLRTEVAFLERPERLAEIAGGVSSLAPLSGAQLMTAEDFEIAFAAATSRSGDAMSRPAAPMAVAGLE
jgi:hypothetical protein